MGVNRWTCRSALVLSSLAACVLLSACGGGDSGSGEEARDTIAANAPGLEQDDTSNVTVVFHLTGLVLVVPPKSANGTVHVLLPNAANHPVTWLGFGMGPDSATYARRLCEGGREGNAARAKGICYVNLRAWTLQPFGAGGEPTDPKEKPLPPEVVDVTHGSGKEHKVHIPWITGQYRSRIEFLAGEPGSGSCSLASWRYRPVNAKGELQDSVRLHMINVLDWEIKNPTELKLMFRRVGQATRYTVPLPPADANGRIELLVAHVPERERPHLPPGTAGTPQSPPYRASHFTAYYNLLRKLDGTPRPVSSNPARRPLPHHPDDLASTGCLVDITRWTTDRKYVREPRALGTYACMVASGQGM